MRAATVCSGIGAPETAMPHWGWSFCSEIEPFPSAVLAHHYPDVPNHGDMSRFKEWPDAAIDVLVGGTPCQSFSVAGLRKGLDDPRGNLALTFLAVADRYRPEWVVWENVPGVLSSGGGRDFGAFLGGLGELGYGWAYRCLDAQWFGLAQRRKRVFVVGHLGDWRRAAAVLFEPEGLRGDSPPSREKGQRTPGTTGISTAISSGQGWWDESDVGATIRAQDSVTKADTLVASTGQISHCLNVGGMGRIDYETETLVAHSLRGEGFDASEDGTGRGTPLVPVHAFDARQSDVIQYGDMAGPLDTDGHTHAICFSAKDYGADAETDLSPTLRAGGHNKSHANAGVMPAVAFQTRGSNIDIGEISGTIGSNADRASGSAPMALTVALRGREGGWVAELGGETATALRASQGGGDKPHVLNAMAVRRLTPVECERLQGFPDNFTLVPYRGKPAADGPRYKALGNSMAVPVVRWVLRRVELMAMIGSEKAA